ncbi:hypothetical protein [Nitrosomonas sp. Nm34]|uniref:hypothetical protein n=1 Tax=Nitrosomonas sp. Nm34 TaxID=1881055 RepID=UPI0008E9B556|nr:hypothetical protein [Nitrosomonas sp. Nm34]SFJ12741.1 hypothetical protein SAMN05428978_11205 [Nitrosomonas sp. Nm34]
MTSHLINENLHAIAVNMRTRTVQGLKEETGCSVSISILLRHHGTHQRTIWTAAPAITFVRNMAEAGFILKHQTEWAMITPVSYHFI